MGCCSDKVAIKYHFQSALEAILKSSFRSRTPKHLDMTTLQGFYVDKTRLSIKRTFPKNAATAINVACCDTSCTG